MSFWSKLNPLNIIESFSDAYQVRQQTKAQRIEAKAKQAIADIEGQTKIHAAKIEARVAEIQHEARLASQDSAQASSYDLQVLKNRSKTLIDDVMIIVVLVSLIAHFLPDYAPYMAEGWKAMGYGGAPWWYEVGIVVAFVSTLGGLQILRMLLARKKPPTQ